MTIELPLARGVMDSAQDIRQAVDPRALALEGPRAAADAGVGAPTEVRVHALAPDGRVLAVPVPGSAGAVALGVLPMDEDAARAAVQTSGDVSFVGMTAGGVAHIMAVVDGGAEFGEVGGAGDPAEWFSLRACGDALGADDSAVAAAGVSLWNWHRSARFCQACGAEVALRDGGWVSGCTGCGRLEYPRQDPAVIMAIRDSGDRLLLAHNTRWEARHWSVLAGFLEAGESPDRAVRREVLEEVGLQVGDVEFLGAQPWPYPRSLMLGYTGTLAVDGEPQVDGVEIDRARFFSRGELLTEIVEGRMDAPPRSTIARVLIDQWYGPGLPTTR